MLFAVYIYVIVYFPYFVTETLRLFSKFTSNCVELCIILFVIYLNTHFLVLLLSD